MASRNNMYGSDQVLEALLSCWESEWSITLNKIIKTNRIDSIKDFESILTFISIGLARTLKTAEEDSYIVDYMAKLVLENKLPNNLLDKMKIEMSIPNFEHIKVAIEQTYILYDLAHIVIENHTNTYFITSDNPVCMYNKFYVERCYKRNYGFGSAGLIIVLPINPQKCLCFYDSRVYNKIDNTVFIIKSTSQISEINKLLVRNSYNNIFFNNQQKEYCIKNIKKAYKKTELKDYISRFGPFIQTSENSILDRFKLDFLEIREEYKVIHLPGHMMGLMRPIVELSQEDIVRKMHKLL